MSTPKSDLVSVQLKTLVNLAKPASLLKLHHSAIRSGQSGGYVSRFKGRGMEFDEARLYQPGDDIRSIDWRVTARTGKTHTKVFREERERPVFISVDNRPTMHFATRGVFKSVQAAKIAALLAWTAQLKGDRIGGQIYTDSACQEIKPQNGKHAVLRFFNALINTHSTVQLEMTLKRSLARLVQHARPGSLVYIISDFRGLEKKSENHLSKLSRHCDVVLIHIYDPLESHLPAKGRYRFTDKQRDVVIDTGDSHRILNYQQHYQERLDYLQRTAKKLGLLFFSAAPRTTLSRFYDNGTQTAARDIHLPETIGWWPPAIGWWVLALLIPLLCWFIFWLYKRITRKTAVKTAKKLLLAIEQDKSLDNKAKLAELSSLVRRVAISQLPRAETASLTGQAWLDFLDKSVPGTPFTQGAGKVLADAHYQKSVTASDIAPVIKLCETWLNAQK